jgi:hypothetical protein
MFWAKSFSRLTQQRPQLLHCLTVAIIMLENNRFTQRVKEANDQGWQGDWATGGPCGGDVERIPDVKWDGVGESADGCRSSLSLADQISVS